MSLFEFVFAFSSVIAALAIGHLLAGAIYIIRRRSIVRFSFTHALWMWSILAFTMGNWAGDWELRSLTEWPAWTLLLLIFSKIVQYMLCVFVTPDLNPNDEKIDLVAFHEREGRNYFWAMVVLGCIALLFNLLFSGLFGNWLRDSTLTLVALGFTFLAILVKAQWAQRLSAVAIAGIATYFLIAASTLGTA